MVIAPDPKPIIAEAEKQELWVFRGSTKTGSPDVRLRVIGHRRVSPSFWVIQVELLDRPEVLDDQLRYVLDPEESIFTHHWANLRKDNRLQPYSITTPSSR